MKNLDETMRHLQKATETLANLNVDEAQPWKIINQMQEMFDINFWENLVRLSKYSEQTKETKETKDEQVQKEVFVPNIDIFETEHLIIVSCEVSGLERQSVRVSLTDDRFLIIKGTIREHDFAHSPVRQERYYGKFARQMKLPAPVSSEGIKASYRDGLLELYFVKDNRSREKRNLKVEL